ncbi:hypothetical protein [Hyalangium gracile]|uniref:hypothetical protein n=1 Tax=Hyalangium gracile TaxID=394092 RepID=UPI001CD02258|nr:hypothetical protein [Hyalangium gracile]
MDSLIFVVSVLAVFAMIHERVLELLRVPLRFIAKPASQAPEAPLPPTHPRTVVDGLTIGSFNWVSAVILALLTHADLLALLSSKPESSNFFKFYMTDERSWDRLFDPATRDAQLLHLLGCVLMGFSTTAGSKFWHDMLSGLMDLRKRLKDAESEARKLTATELKQALESAAGELGDSKATNPAQVLADTARALKNAANKAIEPRPS